MPRINPVDYARTEGHPTELLDGVKRSLGRDAQHGDDDDWLPCCTAG